MNFNKITSAALMALLLAACSDNDVAGGTLRERLFLFMNWIR